MTNWLRAHVFIVVALGLTGAAEANAACTPPHVLTNGTVADASEVMENFDAVAACADAADNAAVKPSGTPSSGSIAVFASNKTVGSGNLTGDVTTSGSTTTTLAPSGVTPGTYTNATIAVDAKGRVTSAASGSGGGGQGAGLIQIQAITADGTSPSVVFSNIPQVFQDLVLTVVGQSETGAVNLHAYANGDTNDANYEHFTWNRWGVSGGPPRIATFPGLSVGAGFSIPVRTEFLAYASSVWMKDGMSEFSYRESAHFFNALYAWKWKNTAPITQLELKMIGSDIAAGTIFVLYGRGSL